MSEIDEVRRAVAATRRAVTQWRRAIREDAGQLTPMQLAVCEARLTSLQRDRYAAEDELARMTEAQS